MLYRILFICVCFSITSLGYSNTVTVNISPILVELRGVQDFVAVQEAEIFEDSTQSVTFEKLRNLETTKAISKNRDLHLNPKR
jgi:hypothetical protein